MALPKIKEKARTQRSQSKISCFPPPGICQTWWVFCWPLAEHVEAQGPPKVGKVSCHPLQRTGT